jgi:hypothetical protein
VEQTRLNQFSLLEGHRTIALPPLLTKQSVTEVFKKVARELAASLPSSRELLATPRAWEVFVGVDFRQNPDSRSRSLALRNYIKSSLIEGRLPGFTLSKADRDRWIRDGTVLPVDLGASLSARNTRKQILRNLNQAYGEARRTNRQFERWVKFVDELVEATFPAFDKERLMAKTPS